MTILSSGGKDKTLAAHTQGVRMQHLADIHVGFVALVMNQPVEKSFGRR
jgi:hypothetical protein